MQGGEEEHTKPCACQGNRMHLGGSLQKSLTMGGSEMPDMSTANGAFTTDEGTY